MGLHRHMLDSLLLQSHGHTAQERSASSWHLSLESCDTEHTVTSNEQQDDCKAGAQAIKQRELAAQKPIEETWNGHGTKYSHRASALRPEGLRAVQLLEHRRDKGTVRTGRTARRKTLVGNIKAGELMTEKLPICSNISRCGTA